MDTSRVLVYSHDDTFLFELTPAEQTERKRRECINGEHSLTITCLRELEKEQRLLTVDGMGKWREYVVMGLKSAHSSSNGKKYTYKCVWSLQHDLSGVRVNKMVGTQTPCTAAHALEQLLSETQRWSVGTVTQATTGGVSMYYVNGWKAMQLLVSTWGGEVDADIEVNGAGVVSRSVSLYSKQGNQSATRRFDWAYDLKGISRDVSESMVYCRVIPRGKGESVGSGYGRKITIEDVNGGIEWLQDDESAQLYRLRTPSGWEYPTAIIENGSIEEPQALKDWALSVIHDYTRPSVTYRADVSQYAEAGMDVKGVALGDAVQCVDRGFSEDGLRIDGRVAEMVTNELDPADVKLTIGHITEGITKRISQLVNNGSVGEAVRAITGGSTTSDGFLSDLIDRLNGEINADGGFWYIIEGLGTRTYDTAVSDPAVGAEASKVVEIRGGSIRIADSRTSSGDWDWKTVFVSGHVAAALVTAARLTAGYIGSPSSGNYWNLDTGELRMASTATIGTKSVSELLQDVASAGVNSIEYGTSTSSTTEPTTWGTTAPTNVPKGDWLWVRTTYKNGTSTVTKAYAGTDGTSVSILGSYNTLAELEAAHPTGSSGDGYIVAGDLYVWDDSAWVDVGRIQGPAGQDGTSVTVRQIEYATSSTEQQPTSGWSATAPSAIAEGSWLWVRTTYTDGSEAVTRSKQGVSGTSVTVSSIKYGTSESASAQPTSWVATAPTSIASGSWLWVKTTYSDGSTATTKSYVGTDGEDGTSVYVASSTKSGDTTTVVLSDGTTLTIADGEDGTNGTNGLNGYVHTAWANSADGRTDFSTSVSANKLYLGVYTDNVAADSQTPASYSWSLIKGANGAKGDKGDKGDTGDAARAYSIVVSPDALKREGDTITPSELIVSATVAVGTATPTTYMGRYRIEEHDGSTWATKYTSSGNESSKTYQPTSTARMVRCTLFAAGGTTTRLDSQTVPVLSDGADGADGTNGTNGQDAYSVWLTNDSHVFPASGSAALEGSTSTYIKAYRGTTLLRPVTIGTLPTPPTGMTLTRLNNGSSTADAGLRINVTTALTTRSGTIDIPVSVDGRSFTVTLSWALALEGVGIKSVIPQYYLSTSSTTVSGGSWSSTPPTWQANHYIWTRSFITWDSNPIKTSTTDAVYDAALTQANQKAAEAKTAVNTLDSNLNQQGIFNRLTNNGQTQGIYLDNDKLYINATYMNTGLIGSVASGNYWDLDNGTLHMAASTMIGGKTASTIASDAVNGQTQSFVFNKLTNNGQTQGIYMSDGRVYLNATYIKTGTMKAGMIQSASGDSYWNLATGVMQLLSYGANLTIGRKDASGLQSKITLGSSMTYETKLGGLFYVQAGSVVTYQGKKYQDAQMFVGDSNGVRLKVSSNKGVAQPYMSVQALNGYLYLDGATYNNKEVVIGASSSAQTYIGSGTLYASGTVSCNSLTQRSDRRSKDHLGYIDGEDAAEFVRSLKPVVFAFKRDGKRHMGFYAQDVQEADLWDTVTVAEEMNEEDGYKPLTIEYQALIAPLVAYTQQLERRIDEQQEMIERLTKRLDALEGR